MYVQNYAFGARSVLSICIAGNDFAETTLSDRMIMAGKGIPSASIDAKT